VTKALLPSCLLPLGSATESVVAGHAPDVLFGDLLSGKRMEHPRMAPGGTFKRAERKRKTTDGEQTQLL